MANENLSPCKPSRALKASSHYGQLSAQDREQRKSQKSSILHTADSHLWRTYSIKTHEDSVFSRKQEFSCGVTCVIKYKPELYPREDVFSALEIPQSASGFIYGKFDEVVSRFVKINIPSDIDFKGSLIVAIPHCMTRNSALYREPVIKAEIAGVWTYLTSQEVHLEDYKDSKFVQARFEKAMPTCACVISRYKQEQIAVTLKTTARVFPLVDQRISLRIDAGTITDKQELILNMQIQPVDVLTLKEVHTNLQPQGYGLISSSSIVCLSWKDLRFRKPVAVCLPIPPNQSRAKRHQAKGASKSGATTDVQQANNTGQIKPQLQSTAKARGKWYMGIFGDDDADEFHFMYYDEGSDTWSPNIEIKVQEVQKDIIQFMLPNAYSRFAVLRTRGFISSADAKVIFNAIEQQLRRRTVRFVLFQGVVDHGHASLFCVLSSRFDELYDDLSNEGWRYFGEKGPPTSKDVSVEEGQILEISLKGNVRFDDKKYSTREADIITRFYFNSQLLTQLEFFVCVSDSHLQKAYEFYKGLCVVSKSRQLSWRPSAISSAQNRSFHGSLILPENLPLCELTLQLTKSIKRSHLPLRPHTALKFMNPKNLEAINFLASKLGKEWEPLGQHLGLPKGRIQAIKMRNKLHPENCKEDMLVTWAKSQTNSGTRLNKLYRALMTCGRIDLAYKLEDIYSDSPSRRNSGSPTPPTVSSTQETKTITPNT